MKPSLSITYWFKDISTPDFLTPSFNSEPFNPRLFNHELFDQELLGMIFSTMNFSTPWLNRLGLKGPGLKLGVKKSGVEMSFNQAISLYLLRRINPESKFYFRSQGNWVNIRHNFVQERSINYSYAGKVGWWANHSLGTVKVPFIYYVSTFLGLKYANIASFSSP